MNAKLLEHRKGNSKSNHLRTLTAHRETDNRLISASRAAYLPGYIAFRPSSLSVLITHTYTHKVITLFELVLENCLIVHNRAKYITRLQKRIALLLNSAANCNASSENETKL